MFRLNRDHVYCSSVLELMPWLRHGFGTRQPSDWLAGDTLTTVRQVHSNKVIVANGNSGLLGEGDAMITADPGTLLSVRTADCLPILIADVRNRAVGAIHAGWRGTVSEIAARTVIAMEREYGSRREDLRAVIGPGIGPCCFEVGPDVGVKFATLFPERDNLYRRTNIDLLEANYRQLVGEGIAHQDVDLARLCTCCGGNQFHSFRRDSEAAGRMTNAIGIQT
jgi:YfiH family protein